MSLRPGSGKAEQSTSELVGVLLGDGEPVGRAGDDAHGDGAGRWQIWRGAHEGWWRKLWASAHACRQARPRPGVAKGGAWRERHRRGRGGATGNGARGDAVGAVCLDPEHGEWGNERRSGGAVG